MNTNKEYLCPNCNKLMIMPKYAKLKRLTCKNCGNQVKINQKEVEIIVPE